MIDLNREGAHGRGRHGRLDSRHHLCVLADDATQGGGTKVERALAAFMRTVDRRSRYAANASVIQVGAVRVELRVIAAEVLFLCPDEHGTRGCTALPGLLDVHRGLAMLSSKASDNASKR